MNIRNPYFDEAIPYLRCLNIGVSLKLDFNLLLGMAVKARDRLTKKYAWAIPNSNALQAIADWVGDKGRIIEIGAGTGYWGWLLSQLGVRITCYDNHPYSNQWCDGTKWFDVLVGSYEKLIDEVEEVVLFLCWPPYEDRLVTDCLDAFKGRRLIYVGENNACTGWDSRLNPGGCWARVKIIEIPQYHGIHDCVMFFEKKG